jgi:2,4-dienoyl-CoA reductase-like NADH-dependent reductase (Old Yellow Enzyme family)
MNSRNSEDGKLDQVDLRTLKDLEELARRLGVEIPVLHAENRGQTPIPQTESVSVPDFQEASHEATTSEEAPYGATTNGDVSILARPVTVGALVTPNSLAIHPMEGCDAGADGAPGELTVRRYERFAAGGAGLLWFEAMAVAREGRANPRQLWLTAANAGVFASLVDRARRAAAEANGKEHRPVLVAQLTHSGRQSRPDGQAAPVIAAHDPYRDAAGHVAADWPVATDEYLDLLADDYVAAARRAFAAGFDAVDVKACHGYLLDEMLGARTRPGKYGGAFANRTRFLLEVMDRIRAEMPAGKQVTMRLGVYDVVPHPYGWGVEESEIEPAKHPYCQADAKQWDFIPKPYLTEPLALAALLAARGVHMINITAGNPYYNPHINRPYNKPASGGYEEPEHPLAGVARLIGLAAQVQRSQPQMAVVGTGYSWLRTWFANVGAAAKASGMATIIGVGRLALAYPDFARDIVRNGRLDPQKVCMACSACTQIMRDGGMAGCPIRDQKVYGPIYRQGRKGKN